MATNIPRHERLWKKSESGSEYGAFGADCDRVLYSSAFRRLSGVTQVVSASETGLFHNRLTHSYKVAQVGARIAHTVLGQMEDDPKVRAAVEEHGGLNTKVVRAACYAHDLGHPPFGHVAEEELNRMLWPGAEDTERPVDYQIDAEYRIPDGFEGNAQSFRIVTKLAFREKNAVALDLTRATLRAVLKYPWMRHEDLGDVDPLLKDKRQDKWGAYDSERALLEFARGEGHDRREVRFHGRDATEFRTIEAQIMDWADDITYAVHDIEDFFRSGFIPLDQLKNDNAAFERFLAAMWDSIEPLVGTPTGAVDEHDITFDNVAGWMERLRKNHFPEAPYAGRRRDREGLHTFASELIRTATERITVTADGLVVPGARQFAIVEYLKKMTKYYVIQRPGISSAQRGQRLLVRRLLNRLIQWAEDSRVVAKLEARLGGAASGTGGRGTSFDEAVSDSVLADLGEFPVRLVDYLVVAFDPDPRIGCLKYYDPERAQWTDYTAKQRLSRAIVDYIVSLTESQAVALDARLSGLPAESMLEKWVSA